MARRSVFARPRPFGSRRCAKRIRRRAVYGKRCRTLLLASPRWRYGASSRFHLDRLMDAPPRDAEHSALFDHWLHHFAARLPAASREDWTAVLEALARELARVREVQQRYYRMHSELWSHLL